MKARKRIKVLQVSNHYWPCVGGIEKVVWDLNKILERKGIQSDVCCLNTDFQGKELPSFEKNWNTRIFRIPFLDLKYYKIATKVLDIAKDYDIIHVHGIGFFSDFLALTKRIHKKPLVLSTHGGIFHTEKLNAIKKVYFESLQKHFLGKFEKVFACSQSDFEIFSKVSKNTVLAVNGIDFTQFKNTGKKKKKQLIVAGGRFASNKQLGKIAEAFALAERKKKGIELLFIGKDSFDGSLESLKKAITENNIEGIARIVENPSDEEFGQSIGSAGFFASASRHEGFGIMALESMASGAIPLLNGIPAFKQLVQNGKNGFIIDFDDAEKASEKILKALSLSDKAMEKMRKDAVKRAREFDFSKSVGIIAREYERLVGKAGE